MGDIGPYRAYSKPHIPQLRPGIRERETYPPPRAPPYPTNLHRQTAQMATSQVTQQYRSFTDFPAIPMPVVLEYRFPKTDPSPAPSFVSEVSAMEVGDNDNEIPPHMHPPLLRPGFQVDHTKISQSRRRRAMMEAALGVAGGK